MRNIALRLEYDGSGFVGSQYQASGRTVQAELEHAWLRFTGEERRWSLAGRTDSGVHAVGQVANIHTESQHPLETVLRAMNALLPPDIKVHEVWEVPERFHARFSARRREYRYLLLNSKSPSALLRQRALHVPQPLDVAAMNKALATLVGEHDFAAFAGGGQDATGSTVRFVYSAQCVITADQLLPWPIIQIDIAANAFLRHMVRTIVGTLLLVGAGTLAPADFAAILEGRDRSRAGPTAPAHGLYLMAVHYDPAVAPLERLGDPEENFDDENL